MLEPEPRPGPARASQFSLLGLPVDLALPSLAVTMLWFLGCMNVWNLIDGMDGLASGVGLLVSGTLTLVAIHNENVEVAILAVALAGSLAGFLLYNWHPACIFLGDSGSLLIGLLIGVIGVQGSMKGPSAISILFPILAMGLPISDTAMAIFRRWVRNLPLSAADRRHVHHLLIGLGLNPRQAALMLYCFSGFLCGAVLLGVALRSEFLALVLGISGCLAFLVVVTSRRDELTNLRGRLPGADGAGPAGAAGGQADLGGHPADRALRLGHGRLRDRRADGPAPGLRPDPGLLHERRLATAARPPEVRSGRWPASASALSGPGAIFRLSGGEGLWITVRVELGRRAGPGGGHRLSLPRAARPGAGRAAGVVPVHRVEHVGAVDSGDRDRYGRAAGRGVLVPARRASGDGRRHLPGPGDEAAGPPAARRVRPRGSPWRSPSTAPTGLARR